MDGEWLTYAEAADRLGVTPEAARRLAIRGRWQRMPGDDGWTYVRLPEAWRSPDKPPAAILNVLEAHIEALKRENATLRAQLAAENQVAEFAEPGARRTKAKPRRLSRR